MKHHWKLLSLLLCLALCCTALGCTTPSAPSEPSDETEQGDPSTPSEQPEELDIDALPDGPQDKILPDADVYATSAETITAYTGEELEVKLANRAYGGAQYVTKLFTEGLGRGPSANEYLYYMQQIETNGCNIETLTTITEQFFSAKAFLSLKLEPAYEVMAVSRAGCFTPTNRAVECYKK